MTLRFTFGNVIGAITTVAGFLVGHSDLITAASPKTGATIVTIGAIILGLTKNIVSHNADQIPAPNVVPIIPGVILEKTGPIKLQTP